MVPAKDDVPRPGKLITVNEAIAAAKRRVERREEAGAYVYKNLVLAGGHDRPAS